MTSLLIGGDSEIGAAAFRHMATVGHSAHATTRRADGRSPPDRIFFDLAAPLSTWQLPTDTEAACIFAAIARLKACEDDPRGTARINVAQTAALIDRLLAMGAYVLFLSTNQVFDGARPLMPADAPHSPVSEYGRQKAQVETKMIEAMGKGRPAAILRLGKVVSPGMELLLTWRDRLAGGQPVQAFSDMVMAPVPVAVVAQAVDALLQAKRPGIWQLTGPRDVSYAAAAEHIARRVGADLTLVEAVGTASAGIAIGGNVANTTLDSSALATDFKITVPDAGAVIDRLIGSPA